MANLDWARPFTRLDCFFNISIIIVIKCLTLRSFEIFFLHLVSCNGSRGFSCGVAHSGGCLISVFRGFSVSVGKFSFSQGEWALGYHSMEFRQFPDIS